MTKRLLTTEPTRDWIEIAKDGANIVLRNPRTNATTILPKDASPHEIREAKLSLQTIGEAHPLANLPAGVALDTMAGTKPTPQADDPEPIRPLQGVGRDTPFRRRQEAEWQAWQQRQNAKRQRERELADIDRLADAVADRIKTEQPEPEPTPVDDGSQYLPPWAQSFDAFKAQALGGNADASV